MAYGTYAEDTYKFKPNLTVTVGVRWEYETSPQEEHNRIANFYGPGDPPSCTPNTCTGPTVGAPWYHPSRDNFAPRLGFNWDPFKKGTTSVRAGAVLKSEAMIRLERRNKDDVEKWLRLQ